MERESVCVCLVVLQPPSINFRCCIPSVSPNDANILLILLMINTVKIGSLVFRSCLGDAVLSLYMAPDHRAGCSAVIYSHKTPIPSHHHQPCKWSSGLALLLLTTGGVSCICNRDLHSTLTWRDLCVPDRVLWYVGQRASGAGIERESWRLGPWHKRMCTKLTSPTQHWAINDGIAWWRKAERDFAH